MLAEIGTLGVLALSLWQEWRYHRDKRAATYRVRTGLGIRRAFEVTILVLPPRTDRSYALLIKARKKGLLIAKRGDKPVPAVSEDGKLLPDYSRVYGRPLFQSKLVETEGPYLVARLLLYHEEQVSNPYTTVSEAAVTVAVWDTLSTRAVVRRRDTWTPSVGADIA